MVAHDTAPVPQPAGGVRRSPSVHGLAAVLVGAGLCVTAFVTLAVLVGGHPGPFSADTTVMDDFIRTRNGVVTVLAQIVSVVTDPAATAAIVLVVILWLLFRAKDRGSAVFLVSTALVTAVVLEGAKTVIGRPRPSTSLQLVLETNHSFPSGHVTGIVAVLGAVALVARARGARSSVVVPVWSALVVVVVLDRLYLGVHWLSDVLGGLLLGAALLLLAIVVHRILGARRTRTPTP